MSIVCICLFVYKTKQTKVNKQMSIVCIHVKKYIKQYNSYSLNSFKDLSFFSLRLWNGPVVKPCPQTLSAQTPQVQPQPSPTQSNPVQTQISPKGTGADTKIMWATTPPTNCKLLSMKEGSHMGPTTNPKSKTYSKKSPYFSIQKLRWTAR